VASIEKRLRSGRTTWRAHYRTPSGEQRNKSFARKVDADRFVASVEATKAIGSFVDPALARLTIDELATHWLEDQTHLKPSTREHYAGILREHIRPQWGGVKLANVARLRRASTGDRFVEELVAGHGAQGPPGAITDPRHGCQGRPVGSQRQPWRESPAAGEGRPAPPNARPSRGARRGVRPAVDHQ
jgi:Phage integrase, N-terminal SAM-like domain